MVPHLGHTVIVVVVVMATVTGGGGVAADVQMHIDIGKRSTERTGCVCSTILTNFLGSTFYNG